MTFLLSLRAELKKTRKSSLVLVCLIGAAFVPFITLLFDYESAGELQKLSKDPWNIHFQKGVQIVNILFLPLFTLIACSLIPQIEHRNNAWKQVLASPQPFVHVYLSKFLVVQLFILGFLLAFNVLMALSLLGIHFFRGDVAVFQHSINWEVFLSSFLRTYICILGISAFQYWMGVRFKNFILPLVIGTCLWFTAMLIAVEYKQPGAEAFFYTHPILSVHPQHVNLRTEIQWYSLGYTVLFLAVGFADFRRKKFKNA
jgi:lantibiotic transport system permease protein